MTPIQALAAEAINDVFYEGKSLTAILPSIFSRQKPGDSRGLLQAMIFGTLRYQPRLEALTDCLVKQKLKAKDQMLYPLLWVGLYQLLEMQSPVSIAIHQTVESVIALQKPWAKGLVNAVLRNFLREKEALLAEIEPQITAKFLHPYWWCEMLKECFPTHWEAILNANNEHPPMTLRVSSKVSREAYLEQLQAAGIAASPCAYGEEGIRLQNPVDVLMLPGFEAGLVSVQDEAAQLCERLLDVQPEQRVLDVCAAPGGKAAHILERQPKLKELVALDESASRLETMKKDFIRLKLKATFVVQDALELDSSWEQKSFQRILVDAPCSATGVIRRHPDIKYLRRDSDFPALAETQLAILEKVWPLLADEGVLVYATCSIIPEENDGVIEAFLQSEPTAALSEVNLRCGIKTPYGHQILPGDSDMDGFYYARLIKRKEM